MKHEDLVDLVKKSGDYVDDIKYDHLGDFIGLVYVKNYKCKFNEHRMLFPVGIRSYEG